MNNVDIGQKYKRIVQYFWDPEPKNDDDSNELIWCLGKSYKTVIPPHSQLLERPEDSGLLQHTDTSDPKSLAAASHETPPSFPDDKPFHFSPRVLEWPDSFLDDFEARVWMTYRSGFPAIPKATNPSAPLAFSLSVRLRSQLLETHGFTTDTGWGCMIRSGQSLLANALFILHLGRGTRHFSFSNINCLLTVNMTV